MSEEHSVNSSEQNLYVKLRTCPDSLVPFFSAVCHLLPEAGFQSFPTKPFQQLLNLSELAKPHQCDLGIKTEGLLYHPVWIMVIPGRTKHAVLVNNLCM